MVGSEPMAGMRLIHTASRRTVRYGTMERAAGRTLPLGLALLAARLEVDWLDLGDRPPPPEPAPDADDVRQVVVRAASDWDGAVAASWLAALRKRFPRARCWVATVVHRAWPGWDGEIDTPGIDVAASGTGAPLLSHDLAAAVLPVTVLSSPRGRAAVPPVGSGYRAGWLETVRQPAIDLFSPWWGWRERQPPDLAGIGRTAAASGALGRASDFVEPLLALVRAAGYRAVLLRPPPTADLAGWLRPWAQAGRDQGLGVNWHLPWSVSLAAEIDRLPDHLLPESVTWLAAAAPERAPVIARLAARGVRVGIRLRADSDLTWLAVEVVGRWQAVSFEAPGLWPPERLRRAVWLAAMSHRLWWQEISGVRRLHDLLRLMRGGFGVLATLLDHAPPRD